MGNGFNWGGSGGGNQVERLAAQVEASAPKICAVKACLGDAYKGSQYCEEHYIQWLTTTEKAYEPSPSVPVADDYGFVYFVQMGEDGPIKIGKTVDINKRLGGLQTSCPVELRLVSCCRADCRDLEDMAHEALKAHRARGEWFDCHDDVLEAAEIAKQGGAALRRFLTDKG